MNLAWLTVIQSGDYFVHRSKLILLDYVGVHFGDPTFVGFSLTHFLSKADHLGKERARLANAAALFCECMSKKFRRSVWIRSSCGQYGIHWGAYLLAWRESRRWSI